MWRSPLFFMALTGTPELALGNLPSLTGQSNCVKFVQAVHIHPNSEHIQAAVNLVDKLGSEVDNALAKSGIGSTSALRVQLKKSGPELERALKFLDDGSGYEFVIRRTESRREQILENGFLSFHNTSKSRRGSNLSERTLAEAELLRMNQTEYESAGKKHLGAKYGVFARKSTPENAFDAKIASGYGSDKWVLKKG